MWDREGWEGINLRHHGDLVIKQSLEKTYCWWWIIIIFYFLCLYPNTQMKIKNMMAVKN